MNLTQQKTAKSLNISQSCYSQYENGKTLITTLILYTMSKKYNISANYILNFK